jgi:hypothetical protein
MSVKSYNPKGIGMYTERYSKFLLKTFHWPEDGANKNFSKFNFAEKKVIGMCAINKTVMSLPTYCCLEKYLCFLVSPTHVHFINFYVLLE